jgi:hypothetical protein
MGATSPKTLKYLAVKELDRLRCALHLRRNKLVHLSPSMRTIPTFPGRARKIIVGYINFAPCPVNQLITLTLYRRYSYRQCANLWHRPDPSTYMCVAIFYILF